jgi:hypothetical protein
MTTPPKFVMPAKPGAAEQKLLSFARTGATRELKPHEIREVVGLIKAGADLSVYDEDSRATVFEKMIHVALQSDDVARLPQYMGQKLLEEIFRVQPDVTNITQLIEGGADVNQHDLYLRNSLILAALAKRADIADKLIAAGVDVNAQDRDGNTALIVAVQRDDPQMVRLLLAHGARQDLCTTYGHTPLLAAVWGAEDGGINPERMEMALLLVAHGGDPEEQVDGGKSALERLNDAGCQAVAGRLKAVARERAGRNLETLKRKKPGDKFKLKKGPAP